MRLVTMHLKKEPTPKGVRRVPINVRSLTGEVNGQEFESSLERDFLLLVHWDHEVDWYQSQPVKIKFKAPNGDSKTYTPDLLVSYRDNTERKPLLCEVKYREDLAFQWKELKPRFRAARQHAKEQGWEFAIFTEREIRTQYLQNIQFLWSYRFACFHDHHYDRLRLVMAELEECDPATLLEASYSSKTLRGEAMWTLWCMVARQWVKCDLNVPLTMKTRIWVDP